MNNYYNNYDTRVALLEQSISHINESLKDMKELLIKLDDKIDTKIDALDKKFESKIDALDKKIWGLFLMGTGAFAAILTVMAHGFKWF